MTGIPGAKRSMRARMSGLVRAMPAGARDEQSARIVDTLVAWPGWAHAGSVMGYLADQHEADVDRALSVAVARGSVVSAPRMDWDAGTLRPVRIGTLDLVEVRRHGIREPVEGPGPARPVEVVLVPGVAFDPDGGRLGRGAGFYDRFLETLDPDVIVVGVALEAQLVDRVPMEAHDRRVDAVVVGGGGRGERGGGGRMLERGGKGR